MINEKKAEFEEALWLADNIEDVTKNYNNKQKSFALGYVMAGWLIQYTEEDRVKLAKVFSDMIVELAKEREEQD